MSQGHSAINTDAQAGLQQTPGQLLRELVRSGRSFSGNERHCVYLNTNNGPFANISACSGLDFPDDGRAIGITDWNCDGVPDFWVVNRSGPQLRLFVNQTTASAGKHVTVHLEGKDCNRDAIGARLTLRTTANSRPQLRTVRAGSGYLSQSTKWIHFGVGDAEQVASLTIQWPNKNEQTFTKIPANRFYRIVENTADVIPWQPPESSDTDTAPLVTTPTPSATARVNLSRPLPFPGGVPGHANANSNGHLLTLWATWCAPCVTELQEFSQAHDDLQAAGISIQAINVDGPQVAAKPIELKRWLTERGIDLPVSSANATLLDRLQLAHDQVLDDHTTLPLPCSFLFDQHGNLATIYKGPVKPTMLLQDAATLTSAPVERRKLSVPFAGRWSMSPKPRRPLTFALEMLSRDWLTETVDYVKRQSTELSRDPEIEVLLFNLGQAYTRRGEHAAAVTFYRQAIKADPDLEPAHYNLGVTFSLMGDHQQAISHLERAAQLNPESADTWRLLPASLARVGRLKQAITAFERAAKLAPTTAKMNYEWSIMLALDRQIESAIDRFRLAAAKDKRFLDSAALDRFRKALLIDGRSLAALPLSERLRIQEFEAWLRNLSP